jgi:hypothetical protein
VARVRSRRPGAAWTLALALALGCAGGTGVAELDRVLEGAAGLSGGASALDESTVIAGLRDALRVGTERTVSATSSPGGFLANELIRIHTPKSLETMTDTLRAVGMGAKVDELELAMNRAAERAAGEATSVFWKGIQQMSFQDARGILSGGDTAATDYFRRTTSDELRTRFSPIVEEKMAAVGLVQLYDDLVSRYRAIPLASLAGQPPDLRQHVTDGALDGLFTVLGQEEARIRSDPAARTTELLRTVFGR